MHVRKNKVTFILETLGLGIVEKNTDASTISKYIFYNALAMLKTKKVVLHKCIFISQQNICLAFFCFVTLS